MWVLGLLALAAVAVYIHYRLTALLLEIASLRQEVDELGGQIENWRQQRTIMMDKPHASFEQLLQERELMQIFQQVYQAQDAGQLVTTIARNLGRSSGEVELILSLRSHNT